MTGTSWGRGVDDAERWLEMDRNRTWERARVGTVTPETENAVILDLVLPEPPQLLPGQYYLVRAPAQGSIGSVEQAYSVSSSPYPPTHRLEIAVREVAGGRLSPYLVNDLSEGDELELRGPFGFLTWTEEDTGPLVLIGAGSGVAPLMSIMRYAAARGSREPMTMLCTSRTRESVLFFKPLDVLQREHAWLSVTHSYTRSPHDATARYHRRIDAAMLAEVTAATGAKPADRHGASFLVAGPAKMVSDVRQALSSLGVADDRVKSEDHA